ncbi:MAG: TatD family hydrolase [Planctomycetota bacterium]|nr:TatD family hydrolase [Planctomycetota bacterium]
MVIDSHAHLYWKRFDQDREQVIDNALAAGVDHIVIPGTNLATSKEAVELSQAWGHLHSAAGMHPSDSMDDSPESRAALAELMALPECVAIGEAGLDFFHQDNPSLEIQEACFRWQLEKAIEHDKPIIVHCRDSHEDTLRCVRDYPGLRGVLHCFTMGAEEMQAYVDVGFHISFSGVVTYPKNEANREAARLTPEDRILVETDSPFLAPQGYRGKRNEPAYVVHVLREVARVRGMDEGAMATITDNNAKALFDLP